MTLPRIYLTTIVFATKNEPNILLTLTVSSAKLPETPSTIEKTFALHKKSQITVQNFKYTHTYSTNSGPPKPYTWMYNVLGDGTGARPEAANQMSVWFLQEVLTPFLQPMRRMLTFPPFEGVVQWKVYPVGYRLQTWTRDPEDYAIHGLLSQLYFLSSSHHTRRTPPLNRNLIQLYS